MIQLRSIASTARKLLLLAAVATSSAAAMAQEQAEAVRPALAEYNLEQGLALGGYDPTSYFPEGGGKAAKGKSEFQVTHRGVAYRFASEANRGRFVASPAKFEPAYGGWCAYAMSAGKKAEADPESFLIDGGKLLVFYKGFLNDTRKKWKKEGSAKLRPKADASWKSISGEGDGRDVTHLNLDDGLALAGYDPVSYGQDSPRAGDKAITVVHRGVAYRFASAESKSAFLADPTAFESEFGGWCAWAMSQGKKVPVDPEAFVRDEDGLFLFYNRDKRDEWLADRQNMTRSAIQHWKGITAGE